ncbi:5124_t:CDS:1, partial [Ambispora gerdemannii]
ICNIEEQLIIDPNGYQFVLFNTNTTDIQMPDVQSLVVQGSSIELTELEKKITKGILQADINGEVKARPP